MVVLIFCSFICSTILYLYLHKKTRMNVRILYKDNLVASLFGALMGWLEYKLTGNYVISCIIIPASVILTAYAMIQIRFWRTPKREVSKNPDDIVSPADGNVIYINYVTDPNQVIAVKKGRISDLSEITQTNIIKYPCWHIGINMTPFDVHKNCSPISGKIILSKHISGTFHSLKDILSLTENERHTYVIEDKGKNVGVVQIASRGVRRIDSYVKESQDVQIGDWIGMIRFGSQVDVFLPDKVVLNIKVKDQIYAKKTILARWK